MVLSAVVTVHVLHHLVIHTGLELPVEVNVFVINDIYSTMVMYFDTHLTLIEVMYCCCSPSPVCDTQVCQVTQFHLDIREFHFGLNVINIAPHLAWAVFIYI